MTTTPESASVNDDVEALSPTESDPVQLLDGTWVRVSRLRTRETLALVAQAMAQRHLDIVEEHRAAADDRAADIVEMRALDARRIHRHEKGADMRVFGERLFARPRHDQRDARERCVRNVTLGTI